MAHVPARNWLRALDALANPGIFFALLLVAVRAFAGGVSLAWDPVIDPSLAGYVVYFGPGADNYTASIDVGNTTSYTIANLVEGATYHFAATAYDPAHTQSAFSNDVSATIPYSAPVAQFSASTTSGPAPLALNFLNTSTGMISAYAWTFGDGATSSAQSPSHVYFSEGVYTVSLTVTGPGGSSTQTNSNYVTVTGSTRLNVTPTRIAAGGTLTASWSGISAPTSVDWVGLFVPGADSSDYIDRIYVSCSQTPSEPVAVGTCPFEVPNVPAGTYELRLLANNGFTVLATSNPFTVTEPTILNVTPPIIIASGGTVTAVTASWSGIDAPTATDWIGLFVPGSAPSNSIEWIYVSCSKTPAAPVSDGSCPFVLPGVAPGIYELRLFANNSITLLATSNAFLVTTP